MLRSANRTRRLNGITALGLVALLLMFAVCSLSAAWTKSATCDEPLHLAAGYARLKLADFRIDPEDPPLFTYWAMIPHALAGDERSHFHLTPNGRAWDQLLNASWQQWRFVTPALYDTPVNNPEIIVNRSRAAMVIVGVALGACIAAWSWQLAGRAAAIIATALFCFCPNFLGHAPLVKNDVPMTLAMFGMMFAAWRVGRRATVWNIAATSLCLAAGVTTKFSGLILIPMLAITLIVRAMVQAPWRVLAGRTVASRGGKMSFAIVVLLVAGAVTIAGIWASYGFRYSPTPDPRSRVNLELMAQVIAANRATRDAAPHVPTPQEIDAALDDPSPLVQAAFWFDDHRLLPQAFTYGLLYTDATTLQRWSFLLGNRSHTGWWYYFPLAMLFKTPVATLAALFVAIVSVLIVGIARVRRPTFAWSATCLFLPIVLYGAAALHSSLNLGLRHVMPLYPFIFVLIAVQSATLIRRARHRPVLRRVSLMVILVPSIGLVAESLCAWPNYIAFFNVTAGGTRGGIKLLGDSNLDWGQDLALLRDWQRRHPDEKLYLAYFGGADPAYYVRFTNLAAMTVSTAPRLTKPPTEPGVIAVSATILQGIYPEEPLQPLFDELARRKPDEVLGGTIYLYRYQPGG